MSEQTIGARALRSVAVHRSTSAGAGRGRTSLGLGLAVALVSVHLGCATPSSRSSDATEVAVGHQQRVGRLSTFEPRPEGRTDVIDYAGVDKVLEAIVFLSGPSLRTRARRPNPATGTRIVSGHVSPFRLEGNKVKFSRMTPAQQGAVSIVLEDLTSFGNQVAVEHLPRDAQLAYWLNLHNMLVISELMKRYPVRVPRRLEIGPEGIPFHDAPLVEIRGIALSLRDIRLGIVYRNWQDPRVLYGFFHGDLAGPSIRNHAYKPSTVWADLDKNAQKFVNALRGVHRRLRDPTARVSPIYAEARPGLFPDWPEDLLAHLNAFAGPPVASLLANAPAVAIGPYEDRIADLVGGEGTVASRMLSLSATLAGSPYFRMMGEFGFKYRTLARKLRLGTVTVEDITSDKEATEGDDR